MSEEEKEAIEYLNKYIKSDLFYEQEHYDRIKIVLNLIDKLQKENKEYINIFNSTEKIMNGQERTKDKLLKENVELQKENEELHKQVDIEFVEENYIEKSKVVSKNKIIGKIKELEEKDKMFTIELPEDVTIYQYAIEILKELLGE